MVELENSTSIDMQAAVNVRLFPHGVTSKDLFEQHGDIMLKHNPHLDKTSGIGRMQKALSKLYQNGYVRFTERHGNQGRVYFPTDKLLAQYIKAKDPEEPTPMPSDALPANSIEDEPLMTTKTPESTGIKPSAVAAETVRQDAPADLLSDIAVSLEVYGDGVQQLADKMKRLQQLFSPPLQLQPTHELALKTVITIIEPIRPDLAARLTDIRAVCFPPE